MVSGELMTIVKKTRSLKKKKNSSRLWFERFMALVATLNLFLVIFDLSYVPLRDFWLQGNIRLGELTLGFFEFEGIRLDVIPPSISQFITHCDLNLLSKREKPANRCCGVR